MAGVGTTHHVEIGGHYYLVRPGSYQKRVAPQFGARFSTGDPDFNNLSLWQHWAQRCFIGGMDQDLFADDAMYDEGIGLDTSEHERVTLARDLARGSGANWALSSASSPGMKAVIYNSTLYVLAMMGGGVNSELWRYDPGTDGWTKITAFTGVVARSIATFDGKLFIGGVNTAGSAAIVKYSSGALGAWSTLTNPAGVGTNTVYAMRSFQRRLYVCYRTQVWRLKEDLTWDGNTVFYKADQNSDSNYIVSMEVHLGFLYFLSQNGHVHRTDGNSTFDIWSWDGQTYGIAIRSFDGRLFVLTFEFVNTADVGWGVLYQMSGSAVTQLKRWGDNTQAVVIGNLTVYDRKLWYGASNLLGIRPGFGVACYDPVEDAHSVPVSNEDVVTNIRGASPYPSYIVDDQIFFQGTLFAFVRGHGAFKTPYSYHDLRRALRRFDVTAAGGELAPQNGGWLTTSTYDAGTPGVKKLWRKVSIDATTPANTGIVIEYSTNNGTNWTTLATVSGLVGRAQRDYFLNNVISTSLKLRVTLRSTAGTSSPTFWGFVVAYVPVPEPNWLWTFTIVLSDKQVLLDGTEATVDTEAEIAFLNSLYRTKQLVTFTDAEGVQWESTGEPGVLVQDAVFILRDLNQPLEGEVTLTILEAVETY